MQAEKDATGSVSERDLVSFPKAPPTTGPINRMTGAAADPDTPGTMPASQMPPTTPERATPNQPINSPESAPPPATPPTNASQSALPASFSPGLLSGVPDPINQAPQSTDPAPSTPDPQPNAPQRPSPVQRTQQQAQALGIGQNTGPGITEAPEITPQRQPATRTSNQFRNNVVAQQQGSYERARALQNQLMNAPSGFNAEAMSQRIGIQNALDAELQALGYATDGSSSAMQSNTAYDTGVTESTIDANTDLQEKQIGAQTDIDTARISADAQRDTTRDRVLGTLQGANTRAEGQRDSARISAAPSRTEQAKLGIVQQAIENGASREEVFNMLLDEPYQDQELITAGVNEQPVLFQDGSGQIRLIPNDILNQLEAGLGRSLGVGNNRGR